LHKTVALFVSNGPFDSSPSAINTALMLERAGYHVVVIVERSYDSDKTALRDTSVVVHDFDEGTTRWKRGAERLERMIAPTLLRKPEYACLAASKIEDAARILAAEPLVALIGYDPWGLVFASAVAERLGTHVPVVYYSLELYLSYDHAGLEYSERLKELERRCHERAVATIVQDEERAKLLLEDNGIAGGRTFLVPNGPLGEPVREKTAYLHERLGIESGKRVLLHAGGINDFGRALELARAARDFPEDWVLVMHGPIQPDYLRALQAEAKGNVKLSPGLVAYNELPRLVASAHLGIALYANLNRGMYHIASASGKIGQYLRCGLPVVTSRFDNLKRAVEDTGCGVCVDDPAQVAIAAKEIFSDYGAFRERAFRCYEKEYEFGRKFEPVLDFLAKVETGAGGSGE